MPPLLTMRPLTAPPLRTTSWPRFFTVVASATRWSPQTGTQRHNSGAAREAGGVEYLLAAGHRCLQRRAGGDYLLEPPEWTVVLIANPDCSTNSLPLLTVDR